MKVLIIHQTSNQKTLLDFFDTLGSMNEVKELMILSPSGGYDSFRNKYRYNENLKTDNFELVLGEVFLKNRKIVNPYRKGLLKNLKEFKPDIVHVMYEAISLLTFQLSIIKKLYNFNYKLIFYGFENIYPKKVNDFPLFKSIVIRFLRKNIDGGAYANSEGIERLKDLGFNTINIKRIFRPVEICIDDNIKKEPKFTLCYVGRVTEEKGVFDFLKNIKNLNDNINIKIIGKVDNSEKDIFQSLIDGNNQIEYIEEIDYDMLFKVISTFQIMIVPSKTTLKWKEQFGKVIAEGMWTNNIVIGSNSGAIPEVIGDNELIFNENNFPELIDIINKLYLDKEYFNDKLKFMKNRRLEYSYTNVSKEFVKLYKSVL